MKQTEVENFHTSARILQMLQIGLSGSAWISEVSDIMSEHQLGHLPSSYGLGRSPMNGHGTSRLRASDSSMESTSRGPQRAGNF